MVYQTDFREADIADDDVLTDLSALGGATPGDITVPAGVSRITEILVSAAPDFTADAMYGFASAVHLTGSGLARGGEYKFPGPCGGNAGAAATSAANDFNLMPVRYWTNIPVNAGSDIKIQGTLLGEDIGDLHMASVLVFDGQPGPIGDYDYREESLTAANTAVTLAARAGVASGNFDVPGGRKQIVEVKFGSGVKSVAGPLRTIFYLELSGSALVFSANQRFMGNAGGVADDVAISGDSWSTSLVTYRTNIGVKDVGEIQADAQMLEDDVGTGFAIAGIGYR